MCNTPKHFHKSNEHFFGDKLFHCNIPSLEHLHSRVMRSCYFPLELFQSAVLNTSLTTPTPLPISFDYFEYMPDVRLGADQQMEQSFIKALPHLIGCFVACLNRGGYTDDILIVDQASNTINR